jgi:hypothetical protein
MFFSQRSEAVVILADFRSDLFGFASFTRRARAKGTPHGPEGA